MITGDFVLMKAYTGDQPFIFVSYAHSDSNIVFPIIEILQNNGYRVWYDEGLQVGNDWRDELAERINCCHAFIFMQTKQSLNSEYCKQEVYAADSKRNKRKSKSGGKENSLPILTIKLEESEATGGLQLVLAPNQKVSGINASANEIAQELISSKQLEPCREQFRYVEGVNWGPARKGYYFDNRPNYAVFNSIIDNPSFGDERHFLSITGPTQTVGEHLIAIIPGNTYTVEIHYFNDGRPESNASGMGYAQKAKIIVNLPERIIANKPEILQANILTTTGEHKKTWDQVALCCTEDVLIKYVSASLIISNYGKLNGTILSTELFTSGDYIGYNKLSGIIPAGMQFSGVIRFKFDAIPAKSIAFERTVSVDKKLFANHVSVFPGDTLTFRITINNNHFDDINVTFRDELPEGLELIPDSTMLYAFPNIEGQKLSDHFISNGVNIGLIRKNDTGVIQYKAKVQDDISSNCELISKSYLHFYPAKQSPEQVMKVFSETTCHVNI